MTEKKVVKNKRLIYKAKPYLNKDSLLIHPCINYANLVWGNTNITYLQKINSQQKYVLRLIHNKNRFCHSKGIFGSCETPNKSKLNLLNTAVFIHNKIKTEQPHQHSLRNYRKPQIKLNADFEFPLEVQQYETT